MSELTIQALESDVAIEESMEEVNTTEDVQETSEQPEVEIDLKELRLKQWRDAIEADLQQLIIEAAKIRKNITEAKTKYKKDFYTKKFNKVSAQIRQYVAALQRLGSPITSEGTDNDRIDSTTEE